MAKTFRSFLVLIIIMAAASQAQAAVNFYLGVQGGWVREKASFDGVAFDTQQNFLYGAKAGVRVFMLSAELAYYTVAEDLTAPESPLSGERVNYSFFGLNLRWIFPILFLNPYLTGGYGTYTADVKDIERQKNGGFNFGAGVEIMLGDKFGLVAEGRYHKVDFDFTTVPGTLTSKHLTLTGGFNLYF
jgi:opacity protein-like surface antigen